MALDYSVIGKRIQKFRKEKNITQEKLAEKLGVSVPYISRLECGKTKINLPRLSQICEILNISEGNILNGSSEKSANYLFDEFQDILIKCSPEKRKLLFKVSKLIAEEK